MVSTNCNVFACATNITVITGVAHPSFIFFLQCIVVPCQKLFSNNQSPPTQKCREDYLCLYEF